MARSRGETRIIFPLKEQRKPFGLSSSANIAAVFLSSGLKKKNRLELGPVGLLGSLRAGSWPGQIHPSCSLPLPAQPLVGLALLGCPGGGPPPLHPARAEGRWFLQLVVGTGAYFSWPLEKGGGSVWMREENAGAQEDAGAWGDAGVQEDARPRSFLVHNILTGSFWGPA